MASYQRPINKNAKTTAIKIINESEFAAPLKLTSVFEDILYKKFFIYF